jgi:hypothetical protein
MSTHAILQNKSKPNFMPVPTHMLQRQCACGQHTVVGGECAECRQKREGTMQRASVNTTAANVVPQIVHDVLSSPGQPLDTDARSFMEPRFGHDFSQVRVHTDAKAAESARAVNALAYTVGRDVVFGAGQYTPQKTEGKRLTAHELVHTIQQGSGLQRVPATLETSNPEDVAEKEAQAAADAVVQGRSFAPRALQAPLIAREPPPSTPPAPPVATSAAPASASTAIKTVKVWLNAFIPDSVPGKTKPAPGPLAGKTMLDGPIFSECYLTDNRSFDSDIHASSRMHSEIEIDVSGPSETFHWHHCDETHEVNCTTGAAVCTKSGRTSDMAFTGLRGSSASTIQVDLKGASNNPCYSGSPDIDYEGAVTINVGSRTVEFDGKIDEFPAFEMYATANGGAGVTMFNTRPLPGKDPWNLMGAANRVQTGTAKI